MRGVDLYDLPLTALRMALELGCVFILLHPLERRKLGPVPVWAALPLYAALMALAGWWVGDSYIYYTYLYTPLQMLFLLSCWKISPKDAVYYGLVVFLSTYSLRQFCNMYHWAMYGDLAAGTIWWLYARLIVTAFQTLVVAAIYRLLRRYVFRYPGRRLRWRTLVLFWLMAFPVFYLGNLGIWTSLGVENMSMGDAVAGLFCSMCALIAVIGYDNALALSQKEQELVRLQSMLQSQQKQYEIKKETIDLLNRKYHDLKHHVLCLDRAENEKARREYVRALDNELNAYAALQNTGSETLDIIMTEKGLECQKKGIRLLLLVKGALLGFLRPLDVAAIFGNALDNAIRAVEKLPEERREITVRMIERQGWLVLRFENEYAGELARGEDGSLLSTREDETAFHGFGIKSIEYTANRYAGNVSVETEGQRFILNILLPRPL